MGMGIPWESNGNGNNTPTWEWECEGVGINVDGNGNNPHPHGLNSHGFYCCRLALGCRPILCTCILTVEIFLYDFKSIVNGVFRIFIVQRLISSFQWNFLLGIPWDGNTT